MSILKNIAGSSNSNQAVEISIVQPGQESPKTLSTFHPRFTYPIFGDQESIFGYQGLRIGIRFAAHDLRSNIQITHEKRFEAVGDTKATDIEGTLKDWIPSSKPLLFPRFYSAKRLNGWGDSRLSQRYPLWRASSKLFGQRLQATWISHWDLYQSQSRFWDMERRVDGSRGQGTHWTNANIYFLLRRGWKATWSWWRSMDAVAMAGIFRVIANVAFSIDQ